MMLGMRFLDRVAHYIPIANWLPRYRRVDLPGDLMAGTIVTIMLVPQAMAYALLAGLPPQIGLYASILPLLLYSAFGTSRTLAVGPVAIISLLVASSAGAIAEAGNSAYLGVVLVLALSSGLILLATGIARLGFIVNFLSHSVVSGFTSAAALVIGISQLRSLLGFDIPRSHLITDTVQYAWTHLAETNAATALVAIGAILILLLTRSPLEAALRRVRAPTHVLTVATKAGPLLAVVLGTLFVWSLQLDQSHGVAIVGAIPSGLPPVTRPSLDPALWRAILPAAGLIAFVGFLESISVAKALASKRRQKINANQELIALGTANIGAAFTGGYPVTGGFSRSVVNYTAGANTALASIFTATLVLITVLFLTPLFFYLPKAVLAAIIVVAVTNLVDIKSLRLAWQYNKADAVAQIVTFAAVLTIGIEKGILAGVAVSIALYLYRTSRPHVAIVGRVGDTEHFRNIDRHEVRTCPDILAVRIDESLYFANTRFLEDTLLATVADQPQVRHVVLICSAVNLIDTGALEALENIVDELADSGVTLHLAEVKGPVMDRLARTDFLRRLTPGRVFLSTHEAMVALAQ